MRKRAWDRYVLMVRVNILTCKICNKYIYIHLFVYVNITKMYHICEHDFQFSHFMNEDVNITVKASGSHNQDDMLAHVSVF